MEKFSNATSFRQIALQNLQRKNLGFSETDMHFLRFKKSPALHLGLQRKWKHNISIPWIKSLESEAKIA